MGLQVGRHPVAGVTWPVGCKLRVLSLYLRSRAMIIPLDAPLAATLHI